MLTKVVYNNKTFKIIDEYGFKFSNNEVTFNDIKIDFTNGSIADIPYKYQEIKIMQLDDNENIENGKVLFTGYLDDIKLSDMILKKEEEDREIILTLLSPLKMATKRNVSLIGTYELKTAIQMIIQPLIDDGFILREINVPNEQITTNYVLETVEYEMNDIGFKRNIFWYINEQKEIFINSIEYLFGLSISKNITQKIKEQGLLKMQPTISSIDYANIVNFKNVRLIYSSFNRNDSAKQSQYPIMKLNKKIKKGDIINFDNSIIVDEEYLRKHIEENNDSEKRYHSFFIDLHFDGEPVNMLHSYDIFITTTQSDENYNKYLKEGNITFGDDSGEEGDIVLQRDNFYKNLITGFKWNVEKDATIISISSDTALRYTTMKFMYSAEINKLKGIISNSGQIEKTIDYNEKWTTLQELISYARSLMVQNSNVVNQVEIKYDINPNLKIGDLVEIDYPDFYVKGKFAVKDISYTFVNELDKAWIITLKSADLISTYIDLFRPKEKEENKNIIDTVILSEFIEEQVDEKHSIEINNKNHVLNFNL